MEFSKNRFTFITIGVLLVGILIVFRLFDLQVLNSAKYAQKSHNQQTSANNLYDRGTIYLREKNGEILSAATLQEGSILAINPSLIKDPEVTYTLINEVFPIDEADFMRKAKLTSDPYEEIGHHLTEEQAVKIRQKKLPGVSVSEEHWRYYPGSKLASHVIGFVGFVGNALKGRYGIELQAEDILHRDNESSYSNFFAELFSEINDIIFTRNAESDIVLTIEPHTQSYLENVLNGINEKWGTKSVGGIIINPSTGEIVAMAALPDFDPNEYGKEKNPSVFPNPLVESVYEMGSTFKPLTIAAALDAGAITPETKYVDKGFVTLNGSKLSNYDKKGRGEVSMQEVLNQSLNTGTVFAMQQLGKEAFRKYMFSYGITDKTGIDLPNEAAGLTDNLTSKRDVEYGTASFGQGIAITPITMVRALSTLANGGTLIKPHVIAYLKNASGNEDDRKVVEQGRVLKTETSEKITRMLVKVVDEALLHGEVKMEHYSIAAKTGTAQIAMPTGGYYDDRYMHTFFGYFPAYQPKFLIFLFANEPHGAQYASQTLTEPFMDLTKYLINYYEIPPDR